MIDSEIQQVEKYYNLIMEYLVTYSMQILGAILILFIGLWIALPFITMFEKKV